MEIYQERNLIAYVITPKVRESSLPRGESSAVDNPERTSVQARLCHARAHVPEEAFETLFFLSPVMALWTDFLIKYKSGFGEVVGYYTGEHCGFGKACEDLSAIVSRSNCGVCNMITSEGEAICADLKAKIRGHRDGRVRRGGIDSVYVSGFNPPDSRKLLFEPTW